MTLTHDPIERLPYETWLEVLLFAIEHSAAGPLPYLAISSRWQQVILESPPLWAAIVLDGSEDQDPRAVTFLHLSVQHPIDVYYSNPENYGSISDRILQEAYRIRSLTITRTASAVDSNIRGFLKGMSSNGISYPQMLRLDGEWVYFKQSLMELLPLFPNLRRFDSSLSAELWVPPTLEYIKLVTISLTDPHDIYERPSLRSLDINYIGDSEVAPEERPRAWIKHLDQLARCLGNHLQTLIFTAPSDGFLSFMSHISSFPALLSLEIRVDLTGKDPKVAIRPISSHDIRHIKRFNLQLFKQDWNTPISPDKIQDYIGIFTENNALQHLQTFEFKAPFIPTLLILSNKLLASLTKVRSLKLNWFPVSGPETADNLLVEADLPSLVMQDLQTLTLEPASLLKYIEAPQAFKISLIEGLPGPMRDELTGSISQLTVSSAIFDSLNSTPLRNDAVRWRRLERIALESNTLSSTVVNLTSLRVLELSSSYHPIEGRRLLSINGLLVELLRHPAALLSLEHLKTYRMPCWELLFQTLRKRNSARLGSLKILSFIIIPARPILSRLVKLLHGDAEVYTTRDFDLVIDRRGKIEKT